MIISEEMYQRGIVKYRPRVSDAHRGECHVRATDFTEV